MITDKDNNIKTHLLTHFLERIKVDCSLGRKDNKVGVNCDRYFNPLLPSVLVLQQTV